MKSLPDETVVSSPALLVSGITAPDAVVSVNGHLATASQTGAFQLTVSLEGPNILEIVASDIDGNQLSDAVSAIYEP